MEINFTGLLWAYPDELTAFYVYYSGQVAIRRPSGSGLDLN